MTTQTVRMPVVRADLSAYKQLAKDMRAAKDPLVKTLRVRLRAAGEIVAKDARSRAEGFSETIPPSIKVRTSGVTVSVVAGGNGVPLAGLFELGNKKASKTATTFRHPVYGNREVWRDQSMHPYLWPALQAHESEFEAAATEALDSVSKEFLAKG